MRGLPTFFLCTALCSLTCLAQHQVRTSPFWRYAEIGHAHLFIFCSAECHTQVVPLNTHEAHTRTCTHRVALPCKPAPALQAEGGRAAAAWHDSRPPKVQHAGMQCMCVHVLMCVPLLSLSLKAMAIACFVLLTQTARRVLTYIHAHIL